MIATSLAWFFGIATALFWLLYWRTYVRAERLDKRVRDLQRTIALQEQRISQEQTRVTLEQQRGETLELAIQQQTQRIELLVTLNGQLERKLAQRNAPNLYLPAFGRIFVN